MTRLLLTLTAAGALVAPLQRPAPNPDAAALDDFQKRIQAYVEIHQKAEAGLPALPRESTPQQIDQHQRRLGDLIREARASARRGDVFTPASQAVIRRVLQRVFSGEAGAALRAGIMDENPVGLKLTVNQRYPDEVPLSTMPPELLEELPKLPEELEYRFVGDRLIVMDVHAHLIVDFMPQALPRR